MSIPERDAELHEQNDPMEHAVGEVEERRPDHLDGTEVGDVDAGSQANPEMRRDQTPERS